MKRLVMAACAALLLGLIPPAAAQPDGDVEIEITDIPAVHTPGENLPVTVTVHNDGPALEDIPLDLTVQASVPRYRSTVASWIADDSVGSQMLTLERRTVDLQSGETLIDIDVSSDVLTWGNTMSSWGPRGLQASINVDDTTTVDRTFLITEPSFEQEPMGFTALVPMTVSRDELAHVPTAEEHYEESIEALNGDDLTSDEELPGSVSAAVQTAAERAISDIDSLTSPGITLALDASLAAEEYGTADLTGETLESFTNEDGHELFLLPALDADLSAWVNTGHDTLFLPYIDQTALTQEALAGRNVPARSDVLYVPGPMTEPIAELGVDHGAQLIVAKNSDMPPVNRLGWTPSAHVALDQEIDGVIVDDQLSRLLSGDSSLSDLDRRQTMIALTAAHYRERPNDARPLVFSVPRGDETLVQPVDINESLEILDEASWLEGVTLSDIEEATLDPFERQPLGPGQVLDGELTDGMIRTMEDSGRDIFTVGDLTTHPHLFRDAVGATYSIAGSWAWTTNPDQLLNRVVSIQALAVSLTSAIEVQESSTINLISQASEFPVHVSSSLSVPITVAVDVLSEDRRLQFETVSTVLQPNTMTTVSVPVRAVGSGNVSTRVEIIGPAGQIIGIGTETTIRVRADWENVGTAIIAGLFLIILIVGIVRSARRGTRTKPVHETQKEEN